MITRAGAHAGAVTTRGASDVLEIRRANRASSHDPLGPPEPLIPPPPGIDGASLDASCW